MVHGTAEQEKSESAPDYRSCLGKEEPDLVHLN